MKPIYRIRTEVFGDISQSELGEIAGVSRFTVSRWEDPANTSQPDLNHLHRIRTVALARGLPWRDALLFEGNGG